MGKLFCLLGKSGVGKDTLFSRIVDDPELGTALSPVVPYTTRPKREDEVCGVHYHFVSEARMDELERQGKIIEKRRYDTVRGVWYYFTAAFELPLQRDYIIITTPQGVEKLSEKLGPAGMVIIHLIASDKTRLERSILRECEQRLPNYAEVCRRYLADEQDFADTGFSKFAVFEINAGQNIQHSLDAFKKIFSVQKIF
ncbi:MAG: guanylate kinase [Oscillospiraceae bacterium]|nr:guanylate kinase [Oscillospiraceae bacterium]